jgi:hypothetical protein
MDQHFDVSRLFAGSDQPSLGGFGAAGIGAPMEMGLNSIL